MITIRPYQPADAPTLAAYYNELHPAEKVTPRALNGRLSAWSRSWVLSVGKQMAGYACAAPLPGLPGQYDLDVLIARKWQRQGLGSRLVDFLQRELANSEVQSLSWGVAGDQVEIARFLRHCGFSVHHEEQILARSHLADLPQPPDRPHLRVRQKPWGEAIPLFCRLYEAAFAGQPWDQPYSPEEVEADLAAAEDILFLTAGERPLGFAWLHLDEQQEGKIEPIGLVPEAQGKGNGRFLFLSALHELKRRGARRAIIGTWSDHHIAINLYRSLGFRQIQTITYYVYTIHHQEP